MDIVDAIAISGGTGIIYKTDDPETGEDTSHMSEEEITQAMHNAIAWKDGILSNLGKTLIDESNFRNYID
mgnify:CR=1 FL=1